MKYQKIINLLDDTPNQLSNYQYNKSVISYIMPIVTLELKL